jgi:transposase
MRLFADLPEVYLHREPVDFRKAINGLVVIVEQAMDLSPFSGALFVFTNRRCDKLKIVYWDETGFCLWYKRLEKHRFKWPRKAEDTVVTLSEEQFHWLLRGLDITRLQGHDRLDYRAT